MVLVYFLFMVPVLYAAIVIGDKKRGFQSNTPPFPLLVPITGMLLIWELIFFLTMVIVWAVTNHNNTEVSIMWYISYWASFLVGFIIMWLYVIDSEWYQVMRKERKEKKEAVIKQQHEKYGL